MRKVMTELDKLECVEYTIDLLHKALTQHGAFDGRTGDWIDRCKAECIIRRGQYLKSRERLGL